MVILTLQEQQRIRGGSKGCRNIQDAVLCDNMLSVNMLICDNVLSAVNYYHKALRLGCCSSPRSASANRRKTFRYFILSLTLLTIVWTWWKNALHCFLLLLSPLSPIEKVSVPCYRLQFLTFFQLRLICVKLL